MSEAFYDGRMGEALRFAAEAFARKSRKGTRVPYLSHLLAVAATVMEHGGSSDQAIAAVLHDYLEDIPGAAAAELEARFGPEVARLVVALSDALDAEHKGEWRGRKEAYLARLRVEDAAVKLVSAADKLHNTRCLVRDVRAAGDHAYARFKGKKDGTLWYHREVVVALAEGWEHPILGELRAAVADLTRGHVSSER